MADEFEVARVRAEFVVDLKKFIKDLEQGKVSIEDVRRTLDNTSDTSGLERGLDSFADHFVITFGDVMNVLGKVNSAMWSVVEAAAGQEMANKRLADAMKAQGIYTEKALQANIGFAASLQSVTKYSDDEIISAQQLLTTFGLHDKQLRDVSKTTLDFASALNIDLRSAAMLVGKAFTGETSALSRYGIVVDENIPRSEKFDKIIKQLAERFGGAARGEAETFNGKMAIMKNSVDELKETVGNFVIGPLGDLIDGIKDTTDAITESVPAMKAYSASIKDSNKKLADSTGFNVYKQLLNEVTKLSAESGKYWSEVFKKSNDEIVAAYATGQANIRAEDKLTGDQKATGHQNSLMETQMYMDSENYIVTEGQRRNEIAYQEHFDRLKAMREQITADTKAAFITLFKDIGDGWASLGAFMTAIGNALRDAIIGQIADIAAKWLVGTALMRAATLAWKAIEISAAAAVAAARAAAATAWMLWGAIAVGVSIGAAVLAFGNQFAQGGIVPGNSYAGDNVLAAVNSGEMILNRRQQSRLFDMANGMGGGGGGEQTIVVTLDGRVIAQATAENFPAVLRLHGINVS